MHTSPALQRAAVMFLLAVEQRVCLGVETHIWEQTEQVDYSRSTRKHLSIRSDGHITLAPEFKELDSTGVPYLWTVAQDSKGTLFYAGGGPTGATAKVMELARNGKPKVLAEITGLEVHALAIDKQDRVYAAVLPDAKIYRIDAAGKPQLFFDPKCKYVWAMAFDASGNLFVATGDSGLIYKVTPDGKGTKFFDTQETHARSMLIDTDGNLIVGTEPGGLILRITPAGQSFVLFQANKREVTAVAEHAGFIYAAAIGSKPGGVSVSGAAPVLPTSPSPVSGTGVARAGTQPPSLPPAIGSFSAAVSGGSEVYCIQKDGFAERIWRSASDVVYAIAFDAAGKPILGTGNKGTIYRIDSDQLSTELLNAAPTQVTAFLQGQGGTVYAVTGNVGNLYAIGPRLEESGTLASEVLDTGEFSYWGRAHLTSVLHDGSVGLETRSGNLNNPENSWSAWSKVAVSEAGGQVESPAARFLQYRLTLSRAGNSQESPELNAVDIPYLPKNIAPRVGEIEIAPFNYRQPPSNAALERSTTPAGSPTTLTLPAVGQKRPESAGLSLEANSSATLQYSKGYVTVRWNANDPNSDPLSYKLEIKEKGAASWQLLKNNLQDRFYAFDSSAFPDGRYVVKVTASDAPGNVPAGALTSSLESDSFIIDNTPPEILNLSGMTASSTQQRISFTAKDALSWIDKAEYSAGGGDWVLLQPVNKVTDSQTLQFQFEAPKGQPIAIRVFDEDDNAVVKQVPQS